MSWWTYFSGRQQQSINEDNFSKAYTEDRIRVFNYGAGAGVDRCPFSIVNFIHFKLDTKFILGMLDAEEKKEYVRYWYYYVMDCLTHLMKFVSLSALEGLSAMRIISGKEEGAGVGKLFHLDYDMVKNSNATLVNPELLHTFAVVDLRDSPMTITLPEKEPMPSNPNGVRYLSAQIVSEEHYYPVQVKTKPGKHVVTEEMMESRYCLITFRTQVNPASEDDMILGEELRKRILLEQDTKPKNILLSEWNRKEILKFQQRIWKESPNFKPIYGKRGELTLAEHNYSTSMFCGLPPDEGIYFEVISKYSLQTQTLTLKDVPVNSFWALTVYRSHYKLSDSANNSSVIRNEDGSVTLWFGTSCPKCAPKTNFLEIFDGWKGFLRLYSPTEKCHNGEWVCPSFELVQ